MTTQTEIKMTPVTAGTFCWNELATSDTDASTSFYGALFGWVAETTDSGGMNYTIFKKDDQPIAGMMLMDENFPKGTPPSWGYYIAVDDVDATASKAVECGGKVCCEPQEAGEHGRFAVLIDPTGATISVFKGGDGMNPNGIGSFCWNELTTTDTDAATVFYTSLLGWTASLGNLTEEPYTEFKNGDDSAGGMMKMHWEGIPSWLGYVHVANVDETTAAAVGLGATVCAEPCDIPTVGRFSVITDPQGAVLGLFTCFTCSDNDCGCS